LRTTNPIESIFAPIRNRTDAMKRLRTAEFASAVTLALIQRLSKKWRRLRLGGHLKGTRRGHFKVYQGSVATFKVYQ
jgi:transposase-like protein